MKKLSGVFTKVVSLLLVMSIFCSTVSAVQISGESKTSDEVSTTYSSDNIRINTYTDQDGNIILSKYTGGVLTQRNTVFKGNNSYYWREIFGENPANEFVYIDEYVAADTTSTPHIQAGNAIMHGNIQFQNMTAYGYIYNKLVCTCEEIKVGQTTHTFNPFVGEIIDFVAIVLSIFACPAITGLSSFIEALAISEGISVVAGVIKQPFICTLSCEITDYIWQVADSNVPSETKQYTGHMYEINDVRAPDSLKGVTRREPYTPNNWKTSGLAVTFHNAIYGYAPDKIIGWSPLG